MSPLKKMKNGAVALVACASLASIWNCGSDTQENETVGSAETATANVALRLSHVEVPLTDSLVVDCIGADTLHLSLGPKDSGFDLDLFPHEHWKFSAKLYANGALMQKGEIETRLDAGSVVDLSIPMHAVVGFVYVDIPLGFSNPAGIASGLLQVESANGSFEYPMQVEDGSAIFKSGMLPLGLEYTFRLSLADASGTNIYSMEQTFLLDENTPVPELQINSLRAKVSVSIGKAEDVEKEIPLTLPAGKRRPKAGDIVVSEFLVNPNKNDSALYEFVEIYNGSNDSLIIENCFVGKTSLERESAAIEPFVLSPRKATAIADTSAKVPAEFRHAAALPAFNKSNSSTGASIVFHCDGEILDSVYYGKVDSLHLSQVPFSTNSSTTKSPHLNIGAWDDRENPENWCLDAPTPGAATFCN